MQVNRKPTTLLGLFPQFGNSHVGGIQESARVAWQAISDQCAAHLICYSKDTPNGDQPDSRIRKVLEAFNRNDNYDVILVWQIGLLKLLPFLRRQNGSRTVLFLHGIEAWKQHDWLTRRLLSKVNLFLTNSDYTWTRFCQLNPALADRPHETVPLGLSTATGTGISQPAAEPIALIISRLSKDEDYKGHRELINAWPLVLREISGARLLIAGDGDLRGELEQLVHSRGLDRSIQFLGKVTEQTKMDLLKSSRCLVMPSQGEGFGLVYLEAMRLGRPCLVSTLDAGREVVNPHEAGLAANPNDKDALTGALVRLLSDGSEWRGWSNQARQRYEQNYTAAHFQERLLKALWLEMKTVPPAAAGGLSNVNNPQTADPPATAGGTDFMTQP